MKSYGLLNILFKSKIIAKRQKGDKMEKIKDLTVLFLKPCLLFVLIVVYLLIVLFAIQSNDIIPIGKSIGIILFYFYLTQKFMESFLTKLWQYIIPSREDPRDPNKLTAALGAIDRIIYAICFVVQQYTFVGIWLGIKIASRLIEFKGVEIKKNGETSEVIKELGERKNTYLIGNAASLLLGIGAGWLIILLFDLPVPDFWNGK
jgi:hypothetical protein